MNKNTPQFEQPDITPTSRRSRISEVLDSETSAAKVFREARETAEGSTKNLAAARRKLRRNFGR